MVAVCAAMPPRILAIALLLVGPALGQRAPERPEPAPRMDVAVTYSVTTGDEPPTEMRIAYHAASATFRIEPPAASGAAIVILARRGRDEAVMVMESRQAWLPLDAGGNMLRDLELSLASGRVTRLGTLRVADIACTNWRLPEPALGTACVSQRGVLLRREPLQGGRMVATFVDQREQDVARFRPPANFRAITMEEMVAAPR